MTVKAGNVRRLKSKLNTKILQSYLALISVSILTVTMALLPVQTSSAEENTQEKVSLENQFPPPREKHLDDKEALDKDAEKSNSYEPEALLDEPAVFSPRAFRATPIVENKNFTIDKQLRFKNPFAHQKAPEFKIPKENLTDGVLEIPKGTKVILENQHLMFPTTSSEVEFTNQKGKKETVNATYKQLTNSSFEVTLPQMTIGGAATIYFKGVHQQNKNYTNSASFIFQEDSQKCSAEDQRITQRQLPREVTEDEYSDGSPVYINTGWPTSIARDTSILSRQYNQGASYREIARSPWVYNALMYNPEDNWLYAISQIRGEQGDSCYPYGNLLQIDPSNGKVYNLGPLAGKKVPSVPFQTEKDVSFINSGVYANGQYYIANTSTSGTRNIYKVDIDNKTTELVFGDQKSYSEDWAVLPTATNYMWGFQSKSKAGNRQIVERINTENGEIHTWDLTDLRTKDGRRIVSNSAAWGKAWTYSNGNLGFGAGSTGGDQNGFELKISNPDGSNPTFELINIVNNLPASFNTDAASSTVIPQEAPKSNLKIEKVRSETRETVQGLRTYWTITVKNTGEHPSSGGVFDEYLPTDTHYGVLSDPKDPNSARFEGFGERSTIVNGRKPGPSETGDHSGIFAGMNVVALSGIENPFLTGYIGTMPPKSQVEFIVSSAVRKDEAGNIKTVCSPNKVRLISTDEEEDPAESDNVATEVCLYKEAVGKAQPTGNPNEYTATYAVKVTHPMEQDFNSSEVIYGELKDNPQFFGAAKILRAQVVYTDEFGNNTAFKQEGAGPYLLNKKETPKIVKPQGVSGSTGEHTYTITITFKLNSLNSGGGAPTETNESGYKCQFEKGSYSPNFGLMNEAELSGWKKTACIPLEPPKKMGIILQKVQYDPNVPTKIGQANLLTGAEFKVYRADEVGQLNFDSAGMVDSVRNPEVKVQSTEVDGQLEVKNLDAPGTYFLIETKAPSGYSLLAQPVKFTASWAPDGAAQIEILDHSGLVLAENSCENKTASSCDNKIAVLQIADVSTGNLPKTGGYGVGIFALLSALLIGLGLFAAKRQQN